ncbi:MAG: DUF4139 domain-containing protein [Gammaproteobacteria bacterium]|nr:DUF4139 domain-containing protein [Gammaproteobacteria bacterium]
MRGWVLVLALFAGAANAKEVSVRSEAADQKQLTVTVYETDLFHVNEQRLLILPEGRVNLRLADVSPQMQADTLLIRPLVSTNAPKVLEQTLNTQLLTPKSLLENFRGREAKLIKTHPTTGEETAELVTIVSTQQGIVLKTQRHIEATVPGRLIFPDVPIELTPTPAIDILLDNPKQQAQLVELSYLSKGMRWQANYVAELAADGKHLDLTAWATVYNTSDADFSRATLRLVAGDVGQIHQPRNYDMRSKTLMNVAMAESAPPITDAGSDYHLFSITEPTNLADRQQKQLLLFNARQVAVQKNYELMGNGQRYYRHASSEPETQHALIKIAFANRADNQLGFPMPKGAFRVYQRSAQPLLFLGESLIDAQPEQRQVEIGLGRAFDIQAVYQQTDFKQLPAVNGVAQTESAYSIRLRNSSNEAVSVTIAEPIPGDWQLLSSSHPAQSDRTPTARWRLSVPPKQEQVLNYRVRIRQAH